MTRGLTQPPYGDPGRMAERADQIVRGRASRIFSPWTSIQESHARSLEERRREAESQVNERTRPREVTLDNPWISQEISDSMLRTMDSMDIESIPSSMGIGTSSLGNPTINRIQFECDTTLQAELRWVYNILNSYPAPRDRTQAQQEEIMMALVQVAENNSNDIS